MGDLTEDFSRYEFDSVYQGTRTNAPYPQVQNLANNLQILREVIGRPITINSGYRTQEHNDSLSGSASKSRHVVGDAADISIAGISPDDVYCTILELIGRGDMKQGGLGAYIAHTHYDIRGTSARWTKGISTPNCSGVVVPTPPRPVPMPPPVDEEDDMANVVLLHGNKKPGTYFLSSWLTKRHLVMEELIFYRAITVAEAEIEQAILDAIPEIE